MLGGLTGRVAHHSHNAQCAALALQTSGRCYTLLDTLLDTLLGHPCLDHRPRRYQRALTCAKAKQHWRSEPLAGWPGWPGRSPRRSVGGPSALRSSCAAAKVSLLLLLQVAVVVRLHPATVRQRHRTCVLVPRRPSVQTLSPLLFATRTPPFCNSYIFLRGPLPF